MLLVVGGRLLIDWLLTTASRDDDSPEQANAERALLSLLHTRAVPEASTSCPCHAPLLFLHSWRGRMCFTNAAVLQPCREGHMKDQQSDMVVSSLPTSRSGLGRVVRSGT